jgi:hypothetical protein
LYVVIFLAACPQRFVFMTAAAFEAVIVHRGWTKLIKQNYITECHPQLA